jgi:DNA processing protein
MTCKYQQFIDLTDREARLVLGYLSTYDLELICGLTKKLGAVEALNTIIPLVTGSILRTDSAVATNSKDEHIQSPRNMRERVQKFDELLVEINVSRDLEFILKSNITFITPEDDSWPQSFSALKFQEPVGLYVRGSTELNDLSNQCVALVGSRNCTVYGRKITADLSRELSQRGWTICSGGAFGVDIIAHSSAIGHRNVAFLASGVDELTPQSNGPKLEQIINNGGSIVSEYPIHFQPSSFRYLERNRLIAAFSQATVVVEANFRSGALNTVSHACTMNRPIGAVPGPITSPLSCGCNNLIRNQVATLITRFQDIEELASQIGTTKGLPEKFSSINEIKGEVDIMRKLDRFNRITLKQVKTMLEISESECRGILVQMVLAGKIVKRNDDDVWSKVEDD